MDPARFGTPRGRAVAMLRPSAGGKVLVEIQMPELGAEVTEGTLLSWLVAVGDTIAAGDPIAELETDKATVELEAEVGGTVRELVVSEGTEGVAVGAVLAKIESDDEAPAAGPEATSDAAPASESGTAEASEAEAGPSSPSPGAEDSKVPAASPASDASSEIAASPLARRRAAQAGISLDQVAGSGARGKITRADVEAAASGAAASEAKAPPPVDAPAAATQPGSGASESAGGERVRHSAMRRTIARRLSESKQTVPHFYLRVVCRVDELLRVRKTLNETSDTKISVNDFIVRAVALSLREVPAANVSWTDEAMIVYDTVDVSVAVATDGGLITPVVRNADRKGLAVLAEEIRELATRAREGKLAPADYQGGSFTVSNLGMYGIETVYPIVNPPQACILGVGAAEQQAVVADGHIEIGTVMTCTLSADHRAVDGAVGAQFLACFERLIEDPVSMVL